MLSLFSELKRRNVIRVGMAYLAVAWLLIQVADTLVPALHMPDWITTAVVVATLLGLPLALVLAWAFELTPQGLQREGETESAGPVPKRYPRRIDAVIACALLLALGYFVYDKFMLAPARESALVESAARELHHLASQSNSIAVLPFTNMSTDPQQAYFADGLAEELLNLLSTIPELRVAARSSSFAFRDEKLDVGTIGRKLKVNHVLEGSVRTVGKTLRVTAELVDTDSGYQLWSQRFDRQLEDVFAIQDEIAAAVVDGLKISMLGGPPKAKEINPDAFVLYLKGKQLNARPGKSGFQPAVDTLRASLEIEPDYAPAWVQLAWSYWSQAVGHERDMSESMTLARNAAEHALKADDRFAEAYVAKSWMQEYADWDWQGAAESMERALELAPRNPEVWYGAGVSALDAGRTDEAIRLYQRAMELGPGYVAATAGLGAGLLNAGRLDEAETAYRDTLKIDPDSRYVHFYLGITFLARSQPERAQAEMREEGDPLLRDIGNVLVLAALGRKAESDRALEALIEAHRDEARYEIAMTYAWLDDADSAFKWLNEAFARHEPALATLRGDALFANLRPDPRWQEFLDRLAMPR